jgi:hypothetical protein
LCCCLQEELSVTQLQLRRAEGGLARAEAQLEACAARYAHQRQRVASVQLLLSYLLRWGAFVRTAKRLRHKEQQAIEWSTQHRLKRRCDDGPCMRAGGRAGRQARSKA